jgi:hypothetical protein
VAVGIVDTVVCGLAMGEPVAGARLTWYPPDPPMVNVGARRGEGVHKDPDRQKT